MEGYRMILVVYGSKYGCAKDCAEKLAAKLKGEVKVVDAKAVDADALEAADTVVIGGSMYAGKMRKEIPEFCRANLDTLLKKRVALFVCCLTPDSALDYFAQSFPAELIQRAIAKEDFGGELHGDGLGFFDSMVTAVLKKVMAKQSGGIHEASIDRMAKVLDSGSSPE